MMVKWCSVNLHIKSLPVINYHAEAINPNDSRFNDWLFVGLVKQIHFRMPSTATYWWELVVLLPECLTLLSAQGDAKGNEGNCFSLTQIMRSSVHSGCTVRPLTSEFNQQYIEFPDLGAAITESLILQKVSNGLRWPLISAVNGSIISIGSIFKE